MKSLLAKVFVLVLFAVSPEPVRTADVAVVMSSDANLYQEALEGFREVVRHRIVSVHTLKDNPAGWGDELRKLRSTIEPDLVFAIGTAALQAVSREITNIPVIHAMVFNPFNSSISPGKNVTGISMNPSAGQAISLLRELSPKMRRVGIIFDPSSSGPLFSQARSVAQKEGLQLVTREIRSPGEIAAALKSLENEIDVLWLLPDEMIIADEVLQRVFLFFFERKIPVLGLSERHTQMGALLSLSYASAKDMGRQAGEVGNKLVGETKTALIPQFAPRQIKLTVNLKTARKLDLDIPDSIIRRADNAIKAPIYRDGEWWLFKTKTIHSNGKIVAEEHRVTFRDGAFVSDTPSFLRGEDTAGRPSFLPFASVYLTVPERRWLDFPLLAGKTWGFQYHGIFMSNTVFFYPERNLTWARAKAEVVGYVSQPVVTPAGKFDAIEINRVDSVPAFLTYFYSPQTKSVVKLKAEIGRSVSARQFELELVAYGVEGIERKDLR